MAFVLVTLSIAGCGARVSARPELTVPQEMDADVNGAPSPAATTTSMPRPIVSPTSTALAVQEEPTPSTLIASRTASEASSVAQPTVVDSVGISTTVSTTVSITELIQLAVPDRVPLPASIGAPGLKPGVAVNDTEAASTAQAPGVLPTVTPTPLATPAILDAEIPVTPAIVVASLPSATPSGAPTSLPVPTPDSLQPTPDGALRTANVPILMYHYLSAPPADADIYRLDLSVTPELFAAHLDALLAEGYTTITLFDLLANLGKGAALPAKPVVLTFDDGYRDNYENAFPQLAARGMTATFFVVTDFIDKGRPEYLTWDMLREMHNAGMSIQSHGRNHTSLRDRDDNYLVWQALGSLETIQHELGVRPTFVSYPAGEYDQRTIDVFRSANYQAGLTTIQGATHASDDLFQLRRVRVRGTTTPDELLRLLTVDW